MVSQPLVHHRFVELTLLSESPLVKGLCKGRFVGFCWCQEGVGWKAIAMHSLTNSLNDSQIHNYYEVKYLRYIYGGTVQRSSCIIA